MHQLKNQLHPVLRCLRGQQEKHPTPVGDLTGTMTLMRDVEYDGKPLVSAHAEERKASCAAAAAAAAHKMLLFTAWATRA